VAHHPLMREILQQTLGADVKVPPFPQHTGAMGAALFADGTITLGDFGLELLEQFRPDATHRIQLVLLVADLPGERLDFELTTRGFTQDQARTEAALLSSIFYFSPAFPVGGAGKRESRKEGSTEIPLKRQSIVRNAGTKNFIYLFGLLTGPSRDKVSGVM